ncbi:transposase [Cystobacter fuscus]|nr:transposase [Cystobacter fuscus]
MEACRLGRRERIPHRGPQHMEQPHCPTGSYTGRFMTAPSPPRSMLGQAHSGADFAGLLTTDRWSAYEWVDAGLRQLCWAHLTRKGLPADGKRAAPAMGTAGIVQSGVRQ